MRTPLQTGHISCPNGTIHSFIHFDSHDTSTPHEQGHSTTGVWIRVYVYLRTSERDVCAWGVSSTNCWKMLTHKQVSLARVLVKQRNIGSSSSFQHSTRQQEQVSVSDVVCAILYSQSGDKVTFYLRTGQRLSNSSIHSQTKRSASFQALFTAPLLHGLLHNCPQCRDKVRVLSLLPGKESAPTTIPSLSLSQLWWAGFFLRPLCSLATQHGWQASSHQIQELKCTHTHL